jgi:glycosyltransferase involved in cell wall biosynthesis
VPRQCGIATFTSHLVDAVSGVHRDLDVSVACMNDDPRGYAYPRRVTCQIDEQDVASYQRAAASVNRTGADVVCLQHEFGIFGGPAGSHLLALLERLDMPIVATLHTLRQEPNSEQRYVMMQLHDLCDRFVVMSQRAVRFLIDVYGFDPDRIDMIHHGIPDVPFGLKRACSESTRAGTRKLLLTFGLLGPGKGIEHVIRALPSIAAAHLDVTYMVVGATHPNLKRHEGERYRESLEQLAHDLNVSSNVVFHDRFVTQEELEVFLMAADVYVTPYPNIEQICSGTLAYALGCGNAVVSTPYWHAEELLADGRGVLVPVGKPEVIAEAVTGLLSDPKRRLAMQQRAHAFGRQMIWSEVGRRYIESFARAASSVSSRSVARIA